MRFSAKTFELVSFLTDVMKVTCRRCGLPATATYHDSCSGLRELGVKEQPRRLLRSVSGLKLVELADAEVCCGFGGTFCVKYPEISNTMLAKKVKRIAATGADTLIAGDLGCLMNMAGKLKREGSPIHVRHVAEVLAGDSAPPPCRGRVMRSGELTSPANVTKALADTQLQYAMTASRPASSIAARQGARSPARIRSLRDISRDIKNHVLDNLDVYLERFETKVPEAGGHVHWASTAEEARETIIGICRGAGAKIVTKGKSMISEEIDLNDVLEKNGMTPVETDLGEYLVQLRHERPSHIIAPAVHLTRDQVEADFRECPYLPRRARPDRTSDSC